MILTFLIVLACIGWTTWCWWRILPFSTLGKTLSAGLYVAAFLGIFVYFKWGDRMPIWLTAATYEISTSWMIFFVYSLLFFVILTIGKWCHLVPATFLKDSCAGTATVLGALVILLTYGNLHYHHKYREAIDIQTEKPLEKPVRIVLASDLHVGYHNRKKELDRWVRLINNENPDLVLIAGDIIDRDLRPVRTWHYDESFRALQAPVYACLGNHEYISGEEGSERFYADAGITLLRDSVATAEGIRIIGRDDRSNRHRKDLQGIMGQMQSSDPARQDSLFTILLDHQPYHLEEAEQAGIDFQFSGHTHHGQIWPGNWITDAMFEKAFGPYQKGDTRYYVSSGLGLWGGKFRIGTRSEYVVLTLHN